MKRIAELEEEHAVTELKKHSGSTSRKGGGWNFVRDRLKSKTITSKAQRASLVSEHREVKFESPLASHDASPSNSPRPGKGQELEHVQQRRKSSSPRSGNGQMLEHRPGSSSRPQNALDFK